MLRTTLKKNPAEAGRDAEQHNEDEEAGDQHPADRLGIMILIGAHLQARLPFGRIRRQHRDDVIDAARNATRRSRPALKRGVIALMMMSFDKASVSVPSRP